MVTKVSLINEALKVYGIQKEHVFHSRIDEMTGEVVIVTNGGKRVRHRKGAPARVTLSKTDITGEPPEQELVWFEKLNQKIDLKRLFARRKK